MYFQDDFWHAADALPKAQADAFIAACVRYHFTGQEPALKGAPAAMFMLVRDRIELSKTRQDARRKPNQNGNQNANKTDNKTGTKRASKREQNSNQNANKTGTDNAVCSGVSSAFDAGFASLVLEREKEKEKKSALTGAKEKRDMRSRQEGATDGEHYDFEAYDRA